MVDVENSEPDETPTDERPTIEQPVVQEDTPTTEPSTAPVTENTEEHTKMTQASNEKKPGRVKRFFRGYWTKKKWTLPLTVIILIALILGVPASRYKVLGLFLKQTFTISVMDSGTNKPISGASVTLANKVASTDASGKASLRVPVGPQKLTVVKKYYKSVSANVTVPLQHASSAYRVQFIATGRQVPITVLDKISGKGIADVAISVLGTNTKTDSEGKAIIVLPTTAATQMATLQLTGYNTTTATIQVTDQVVTANSFTLVPAGKLYFLSNLSGKIDVVKTDLDGANRQTVLAGTGSEDPASTSLLASRDWKYLALLAKRDNGQQGIYLINTSNDSVTNIDGGSSTASFTLVGWSNDTFVYQVSRSNISNWQPGAQALKSYDATAGKLYNIDQTQGEGTSSTDYGFTNFSSVYILNNELVYVKNWYSSFATNHLNGKSVSFISVQADGSNKKDVQDFPIPAGNQYFYVNLTPYEPQGVYLSVPTASGNTFYQYEDGTLSQQSSVTDDIFNKQYPTFLVSPSGKQTFWSDIRDNKNSLFVGDANAQSPKQIASLSDYATYGWFSDNYLLVTKNGSELYIMPADGSKPPLKITDYYKPQLTYRGYGGGYGGI